MLAPGTLTDHTFHTLADLDRRFNDHLRPVVPIAGRRRITDGDAVHQQFRCAHGSAIGTLPP
jgi:hypothetical protein